MPRSHLADLALDHVVYSVTDLSSQVDWWTGAYGLSVYAAGETPTARMVGLGTRRIQMVLVEAAADDPAAEFTDRHGDGISDIALSVTDTRAAFQEAVRRGARPVAPPAERDGFVQAAIQGFGDVTHTFIQRPPDTDPRALPNLRPWAGAGAGGLLEVDHFAVCVEPGEIDSVVAFYCDVLDFRKTFAEHIVVGDQAMTTKVVQGGNVTLTLIEPDISCREGHVFEFLEDHGGPGVQHMAFRTDQILMAIEAAASRGVDFLGAPDAYYDLLPERVGSTRYSIGELRKHSVLVDEDHDGQLYQIFARSVHPRQTFFIELIERLGARSFGTGNISALYQAVESQRTTTSTAGSRP